MCTYICIYIYLCIYLRSKSLAEDGEELAKPRPEHEAVAKLTAKELSRAGPSGCPNSYKPLEPRV